MLIRSAIFLATFGTELQLKPTCNFEENLSQTKDIMSKLPSSSLENLASRCNDVTSPTVEYPFRRLSFYLNIHNNTDLESIGYPMVCFINGCDDWGRNSSELKKV
jgi:hypothetical protein